MVELHNLSDNKGARKNRIRVGRGIGCGKGKTCGRGVKGQKSRSGVAIKGFEGGQMPIFKRLPKRGFTNIHRTEYYVVNLNDLSQAIAAKKLKSGDVVDVQKLVQAGIIRDAQKSVKLLGNGELKEKLTIQVDKASKSASEAVSAAGGTLEVQSQ